MSTSTPVVFPAKAPLPEIADGITVVSFNVLLPNGNDGWWMYKVSLVEDAPCALVFYEKERAQQRSLLAG